MVEWVSATQAHATGGVTVIWRPEGTEPGETVPVVVTQYVTVPESGRYRVRSLTTYAVGEWECEEPGATSGETYPTKREAEAWMRRMAEQEAGNRHAISWDGVPT